MDVILFSIKKIFLPISYWYIDKYTYNIFVSDDKEFLWIYCKYTNNIEAVNGINIYTFGDM